LFGYEGCPFPVVGFVEEIGVVEPDVVDSAVLAPVYAELVFEVCCPHRDVPFVDEPVALQVVRFLLLVLLVVGRHDVDFLPQSYQFPCQFIHHYAQTANGTPLADLWGHEGDGTEGVAGEHGVDVGVQCGLEMRAVGDEFEDAEEFLQFVFVDVEIVVFGDDECEIELCWQNEFIVEQVETRNDAEFSAGGVEEVGEFVEEDGGVDPGGRGAAQSFLHAQTGAGEGLCQFVLLDD
jgi:hypothetical protein